MKNKKTDLDLSIDEIAPYYGLKKDQASLLYRLFIPGLPVNPDEEQQPVFDELDYLYIEETGGFNVWTYELTDAGKKFIDAVHYRLETRQMLKIGCDLFPELASVPGYKPKKWIIKEAGNVIAETETKEQAIVQAKMFIKQYSERSFIIYGETYPQKDKLKDLGARFNRFLKVDGVQTPGWICGFKTAEKIKTELLITCE